jgi:Xaa-Pro aminopeptidase
MAERGIPLPQCIMFESDVLSHSDWLRCEAIFHPARIINGTPAIQRARSIKTDIELEQIRQSGKLHTAVYSKIPELYRQGMTDLEISIEIEREMRRAGCLGAFRVFGQSMEIFMGSVLTGDNAGEASPYDFALGGKGLHPSLPVGANNSVLRRGLSLMVDMGGNFTGYMTDMTRTYSIGKLSEKAYCAHRTALEIQNEIENMMRPGAVCEDMYNRSLEMAKHSGLDGCFMGIRQQARFVGHGVGLEINEFPVLGVRSRTELKKGMVLAIEPKFVIEGVGAVGIENTYVVTATGNEKLTVIDEEIVDLEMGEFH